MRWIALVLLASTALAAAPDTEKGWDAELNRVYGAMMRRLPEPEKKLAKTAQLAWIKFRDAEFARLGDGKATARADVVRQRAEQLAATLAELGQAAPETAAVTAAIGKQTMTGTFAGIEQGDYAHLKLTTADGNEEDFFVRSDANGLKALIDSPKKFVGKKIAVQWEERDEDIPEAGGKIKIRVALGAQVLK
jgi:uncharacterized protein YecT (DUF1311 family)